MGYYSPWSCKELDRSEQLSTHTLQILIYLHPKVLINNIFTDHSKLKIFSYGIKQFSGSYLALMS